MVTRVILLNRSPKRLEKAEEIYTPISPSFVKPEKLKINRTIKRGDKSLLFLSLNLKKTMADNQKTINHEGRPINESNVDPISLPIIPK